MARYTRSRRTYTKRPAKRRTYAKRRTSRPREQVVRLVLESAQASGPLNPRTARPATPQRRIFQG